jgi:anti-sigma regulatory factor (Ser/Thr protein kinase)
LIPTGVDTVVYSAGVEHTSVPRPLTWTFPPEAESVGEVRRLLTTLFVTLPEAQLDDILLAASELVTNAVLYGDGPVEVGASGGPGMVRVEVTDDGGAVPAPRWACDEDEGGRGLLIVDLLATRWGVTPRRPGPGKTVWFEIGDHPTDRDPVG